MTKGRGLKKKEARYLATQNHQVFNGKKARKKLTSIIIMKVDFLYLPVVTDAKIVPRTLTDLTEFFARMNRKMMGQKT